MVKIQELPKCNRHWFLIDELPPVLLQPQFEKAYPRHDYMNQKAQQHKYNMGWYNFTLHYAQICIQNICIENLSNKLTRKIPVGFPQFVLTF